MTASIAQALTGEDRIDGLLTGSKWAGPIDFSFPTLAGQYGSYGRTFDPAGSAPLGFYDETTGLVPLGGATGTPGTQKAAVSAAVSAAVALTNIGISLNVADPATADIRLAMTTTPATSDIRPNEPGLQWTAYAFFPANTARAGDIWFNTVDYNAPRIGSYAWHTVLHEVGHALGLKHGHEQGSASIAAVLPADRDSMEFTVMTYRSFVADDPTDGYDNATNHYAQTYMMLDIAALQAMYGADFTSNAGNTTYRFDPATGAMSIDGVSQGAPALNVLFLTVWDGNGTDTYDFSLYGSDRQMAIDLRPGQWTDVDTDGGTNTTGTATFQAAWLNVADRNEAGYTPIYARGQVFNALQYEGDPRSLIENAIGGAGNDAITGNQADNRLEGRAGNDTLSGATGNDTLLGDAGDDVLNGNDGNDVLQGGDGGDSLRGGQGIDTYQGGAGYDFINFFLEGTPTRGIVASLTTGLITDGFGNAESLGAVNDIEMLIGNALDDDLEGKLIPGDISFLQGRAGNDTLRAGSGGGTDVAADYFGDSDVNNDGIGVRADLRLATGQVTDGWGNTDTLVGIASVRGSDFADTLIGNGAANWFRGQAGNDTIDGQGGFDTASYTGSAAGIVATLSNGAGTVTDGFISGGVASRDQLTGIEQINGSANADTITIAGSQAITIFGNAGNDDITGGAGNDTFTGGDGSDVIRGGAGDDTFRDIANGAMLIDTMTGGSGADRYVLSTLAASSDRLADVITDFETGAGGDRIDMAALLAACAGFVPGSDPFAAFYLRLVQGAFGAVLQLDRNGGGDGFRDLLRLDQVMTESLAPENFVPVQPGLNDPPFVLDLDGAIAETASPGTVVGRFVAGDPDDATLPVFTLVGPAGPFTIAGDALVLAGPLDFETTRSYSLTVRATDPDGAFSDAAVSVAVQDVWEDGTAIAPRFVFSSGAVGPNNQPIGPSQGVGGVVQAVVTPSLGTVIENTGAWNGVKNALTLPAGWTTDLGDVITVANFVDVRLDFSNALDRDLTVNVIGAKRGGLGLATSGVTTGAGDDHVEWVFHSNSNDWNNAAAINAGAGNDLVVVGAVAQSALDEALLADNPAPGNGALWNRTYDGRFSAAQVQGGLGDDTLMAVSGTRVSLVADGGAGNDTLTGANGADTLTGGDGNDALSGAAGADRFRFDLADGADAITDFSALAGDRVVLSGAAAALVLAGSGFDFGTTSVVAANGHVWTMADFLFA